jgi:hypothetical protein
VVTHYNDFNANATPLKKPPKIVTNPQTRTPAEGPAYFSDKIFLLKVKSLCRSYILSPVFNQAFLAGLQAFLGKRGN